MISSSFLRMVLVVLGIFAVCVGESLTHHFFGGKFWLDAIKLSSGVTILGKIVIGEL